VEHHGVLQLIYFVVSCVLVKVWDVVYAERFSDFSFIIIIYVFDDFTIIKIYEVVFILSMLSEGGVLIIYV